VRALRFETVFLDPSGYKGYHRGPVGDP